MKILLIKDLKSKKRKEFVPEELGQTFFSFLGL